MILLLEDIKKLKEETKKRFQKTPIVKKVIQPILTPPQLYYATIASINYKSKNWKKYLSFSLQYIKLYEKDYNKAIQNRNVKKLRYVFEYIYEDGNTDVTPNEKSEDISNLIATDCLLSLIVGVTLKHKKEVCKKIIIRDCTLYKHFDTMPDDIINKILDFCNRYIFIERIDKRKWALTTIFCVPFDEETSKTVLIDDRPKIIQGCGEAHPIKVKHIGQFVNLFDCLAERGIIIEKWQNLIGTLGLFASSRGTTLKSGRLSDALSEFKQNTRKDCPDSRLEADKQNNKLIRVFVGSLQI